MPTVLTGTFLFLYDRDPLYGTLASIFAMLAATVQSGSLVVAAFYLDKASVQYRDEIDAIKDDDEVAAADKVRGCSWLLCESVV